MKFRKKALDLLEMPVEVTSNIPKIIMSGFDEIIVENFVGILEYEDFFVRVKTHIGNIIINGFNMKLIQLNTEDIKICGIISNMSFEKGDIEEK